MENNDTKAEYRRSILDYVKSCGNPFCEPMPEWAQRLAKYNGIRLNELYKDMLDTRQSMEMAGYEFTEPLSYPNSIPEWALAVIDINTNAITHLDQISWATATECWRTDVARDIVECLECEALKVPTVECMLNQWREANPNKIDSTFERFCTQLIINLQSHDLYSIEAIKARQNGGAEAVEDRVGRMELPNELQSDEAQDLLQRAVEAGLCVPEQDGKYRWLKSKRLCAYFADASTVALGISKAASSDKVPFAYFKPFESLFNIDNLKQQKANYKRDGVWPRGFEIVNKVVQG